MICLWVSAETNPWVNDTVELDNVFLLKKFDKLMGDFIMGMCSKMEAMMSDEYDLSSFLGVSLPKDREGHLSLRMYERMWP
jgi:hypothetical protein